MAHFAKVENGIVTQVIVADQEFINSGAVGPSELWVQTSYNSSANQYLDPNTGSIRGDKTSLRKNFAGLGYTYDYDRQAFIPPKPFPSWILDEETCQWKAPVEKPTEYRNYWNEEQLNWVKVGE
jgi:hypothetical protein